MSKEKIARQEDNLLCVKRFIVTTWGYNTEVYSNLMHMFNTCPRLYHQYKVSEKVP